MVGWSCLTGVSPFDSGCQARARPWDSGQRDQPDAADGEAGVEELVQAEAVVEGGEDGVEGGLAGREVRARP
eukprot:620209-Rhodomonas_salina.1